MTKPANMQKDPTNMQKNATNLCASGDVRFVAGSIISIIISSSISSHH
jgi:hypothetical protein